MLASYGQGQFHDDSTFAHQQPTSYSSSTAWKSASGLPVYYNNFQSHEPAAADWDCSGPRLTFGNAPPSPSSQSSDASDYMMSDYSTQTPPIRLHRPSPVLRPAGGATPPRQSAAGDWALYKDLMGQGVQGGPQQGYGSRRVSHQRASSGSSVNSAGPPSPYEPATSQPFIVQPDTPSTHSMYYDGAQIGEQGPHFDMPKALPTPSQTPQRDSFLALDFQNYNTATHDPRSNEQTKLAMLRALQNQRGYSHDSAPTLRTVSGGFSTVDPLSPPTPNSAGTETNEGRVRRGRTGPSDSSAVPKLDRTMSDVYQDELFNPTIYPTVPVNSAPRPAPANNQNLLSPYCNVFSERLKTANQGHIRAKSISPAASLSREKSPFRQGSPYAPSMSSFGGRSPRPNGASTSQAVPSAEVGTCASLAAADGADDVDTPQTISPKDALLEYSESEDDAKMPLFPQSAHGSATSQHGAVEHGYDTINQVKTEDNPQFQTSTAAIQQPIFSFVPPAQSTDLHLLQQYPFVPRPTPAFPVLPPAIEQGPQFPARLVSMESTVSEDSSRDAQRPARTSADGGTYTCTYHGCTRRFETPAKLQKHKREGHRQSLSRTALMVTTDGATASSAAAAAALARNGQAGPHKCDRINPSTGKPCNTIFSRPYDLTRHEDTIHNGGRQKVRCRYCTEDKLFSRNDALTRHMRVVHPDVEFGAKSRRRRQLSSSSL